MYINDEVIELIKLGDEFIFEQFYRAFAPVILKRLTFRIDSSNRLDAEELLQDIMASVPMMLRNNSKINGTNFIFYLMAKVNKEIYRYNRKLKNNFGNLEVEFSEEYEYRFAEKEMLFDIEELNKVLNQLEYNVLTMKFLDRLNYREISKSLDKCSERTVRRTMDKGLKKAKRYLIGKFRDY